MTPCDISLSKTHNITFISIPHFHARGHTLFPVLFVHSTRSSSCSHWPGHCTQDDASFFCMLPKQFHEQRLLYHLSLCHPCIISTSTPYNILSIFARCISVCAPDTYTYYILYCSSWLLCNKTFVLKFPLALKVPC